MREVTEKFNVYTFDDAPKEVKEKIKDYFSYNYNLIM